METYKHITIVDTSNTCQSFMVEVVLNQLIRQRENCDITVVSRGLVVLFPEPVSAKAADLVREHGYAIKNFQSEQLTKEDIERSDLILTITDGEKQKLYADFNPPIGKRIQTIKEFAESPECIVADPYGKDQIIYEHCFFALKYLAERVFYKIV